MLTNTLEYLRIINMPLSLLDLPVDVLVEVFFELDLKSQHCLGATCRKAYHMLHSDSLGLWSLRVRKHCGLKWARDGAQLLTREAQEGCREPDDRRYCGIVKDDAISGYREFYLVTTPDFISFLQRSRSSGTTLSELSRFITSLLFSSPYNASQSHDPNYSARLALFGPGIESPNTKTLVHKMINAHSSVFNGMEAVPGLPGGFGSGIRVDFKQAYFFDLICLYTNSVHVRESHRGVCRLKATHNRLLTRDALRFEVSEGPALHDSVLKLLPTLDALLYAIDVEDLAVAQNLEEEYEFLRSELRLMLHGSMQSASSKKAHPTPLLILCCSSSHIDPSRQPRKREMPSTSEIVRALQLETMEEALCRAWAAYEVDIVNMEGGMVLALEWLLYHTQKTRELDRTMRHGGLGY